MTAQSNITPESIVNDLRYLQLLSRSFPTIADASTEIINLEAILNLPKGTEHFLTDVHGEYEAFQHVLKNASGAVKRKVNEIFGNTLREAEKKEICTLIYYPEEKLQLVKAREKDLDDWYLITLNQLVKVCQNVSSKYTRSKVRKSLPAEFSYIIQELLHESSIEPNKHAYINVIISTIITTKRADDFIIAMGRNSLFTVGFDLHHGTCPAVGHTVGGNCLDFAGNTGVDRHCHECVGIADLLPHQHGIPRLYKRCTGCTDMHAHGNPHQFRQRQRYRSTVFCVLMVCQMHAMQFLHRIQLLSLFRIALHLWQYRTKSPDALCAALPYISTETEWFLR